ncbi:nitrate- and nitrite sensing domain-containing protein [Bailinhaonella thermotolerans]|uniref:histidine kinase n=1 Tax=Bailinhaonella thermotolerans TaxID=1070861 RepID=A0A3A4AWL7_9ACTN|nr:nitrate- and nitrite sensing domain-containing protein [Bailinhaonella thermotolerans]RJL32687.1 HAMP domain-containing protein [Bailinhaonella thermotolerans]
MASRSRSIRFKIFTLLVMPVASLILLWGFTAGFTVPDGLRLKRIQGAVDLVASPAEDVVVELQAERRLSVAHMSRYTPEGYAELRAQRAKTDKMHQTFRRLALSPEGVAATSEDMRQPVADMLDRLDRLPEMRNRIDAHRVTRLEAIRAYNAVVDAQFRLYDKLILVPDVEIHQQATAITAMGEAREMITRESALISAIIGGDNLTPGERKAFSEWVTARRFLQGKALRQLDEDLRGPYVDFAESPLFGQFENVEDAIIGSSRATVPLPADAADWQKMAERLKRTADKLQATQAYRLVDRIEGVAVGILVRVGLLAGLGLVAVVVSVLLSLRFGRRLARELVNLRRAALVLAADRLPTVIDRLSRGDDVDVDAEAPELHLRGTSEISDVGAAFTTVQRTAITAAVGQAALRRGVAQVFLNLARRNQSLLHRQLALLDTMERRDVDAQTLEDLFRLDHLTTRMRRHAEGLIILSGALPGRGWRNPVPILDVVRGAVAEVEDYQRVTVHVPPGPALLGAAVADVIHLIAELVENATIFSPPHTEVRVRGEIVGSGYAIEVEDRGLGLSAEEFDAINEKLATPPEFDLADSDRLGLFVVGRLAHRHDIRVVLRPSPYGGTTAIVLLPAALVVEAPRERELVAVGPQTSAAPESRPALEAVRTRPAEDVAELVTPLRAAPEAPEPPRPAVLPVRGTDGESAPGPVLPMEGVVRDALPRRVAGTRPAPDARGSGAPDARATDARATDGRASDGRAADTHKGLPRRVRQASLAPQLRQARPRTAAPVNGADGDPEDTGTARSPEETRAIFASFQDGVRRGRRDAQELDGKKGDE